MTTDDNSIKVPLSRHNFPLQIGLPYLVGTTQRAKVDYSEGKMMKNSARRIISMVLVIALAFGTAFTGVPIKSYASDEPLLDLLFEPGSEVETMGAPNIYTSDITLSDTLVQLKIDATYALTLGLLQEDSKSLNVEWLSSDEEIAVVDAGIITALAEGIVEITVRSIDNPAITAVCVVEVVTADQVDEYADIADGETETKDGILSEQVLSAMSSMAAIGDGYGSNGKFLAPIEPPAAGSIPIETVEDLMAIRDDLSASYHLTKDIDLAGIEWTPIGTYDEPFRGIFDGQGHVNSNLTITGMDSGVFGNYYTQSLSNYSFMGFVSAIGSRHTTISNLALEGVSINLNFNAIPQNPNLSKRYLYICPLGSLGGSLYSSSYSLIVSNCYTTGIVEVDVSADSDHAFEIISAGIVSTAHRIQDSFNKTEVTVRLFLASSDPSTSIRNSPVSVRAFGMAATSDPAQNGSNSILRCYNMGNISA